MMRLEKRIKVFFSDFIGVIIPGIGASIIMEKTLEQRFL